MKTLDKFLLIELLKTFKKCDIAYYIDDIQPYNKAMASIRMQCYDMIEWFGKQGIRAELYKPLKKYKAVFFIKTRSDRAVKTARKLHAQGTILIMYAYSEVIDDELRHENWERENILELIQTMDAICVVGKIQYEKFSKYHKNVVIVGDSVHEDFFKVKKNHLNKKELTLVYCGYHKKTKDTLAIKDVILKLQEQYNCEIILLTDRDPQIQDFPYRFIKYDQRNIAIQFTLGDIMVAPRPMEGIESLSHSNTKIAYPMAVGLPVVASPVPSYLNSPAILCSNDEEWYRELEHLITDYEYREELGEKGRQYIWENYSVPKIGERYLKMIQKSMNKSLL